MKKWTIITIFLCLGILSCEKSGSYCVKIIENSSKTTTLSKSEMEVVKNLFNRNQLDYTKYQFTKIKKDELGYCHIWCYQFANNLMIFTGDVVFHFDKYDMYNFLSGDLISSIDLDTKFSMKKNNVVKKFIDRIEQDDSNKGNRKKTNGCFDVEYGYYDLNAGKGYADKKFTKAWKITSRKEKYPFAYINDENSEIIYYDNGIRY